MPISPRVKTKIMKRKRRKKRKKVKGFKKIGENASEFKPVSREELELRFQKAHGKDVKVISMNPLIVKIKGKAVMVLDGIERLLLWNMAFTGQPVAVDSKNRMIIDRRRKGISPPARRYVKGEVFQVLNERYGRADAPPIGEETAFNNTEKIVRNQRKRKGTPADRK